MGIKTLLTNAAVVSQSAAVDYSNPCTEHRSNKVLQAFGKVTTSTGTAAVDLEGSMDGTNWTSLGTINLTLGTVNTNGKLATTEAWAYLRANLKTLTGTGPTVTAILGD